MPLICVALLAIAFGAYFLFFKAPTEVPNTENTNPTVDQTIATEPTIDPTEPIQTEPEPTDPPEPPKDLIDNTNKYVGVYVEDPKKANVFTGGINTLGWFDTFDKISYSKISICLDEGLYRAFITLEPTNMSLSGIVNGEYDDKFIAYFNEVSRGDRVNTELFVRFAHEMEMRPSYGKPWYSWQGDDSEAYVAAWRYVITLGRQYAPNIKWVWSPNRADKYTDAYYPGDEYVDYVGITLNHTSSRDQAFGDFYTSVGKKEELEKYGKPIIFSEVARHRASQEIQSNYIISALDYVKENENCIGIVFFDKYVTSDRRYQFSDDQVIMERFIEKAKELIFVEEA